MWMARDIQVRPSSDCKANPAGTYLYLLDDRDNVLLRYTVATPSVAPVVISSFPAESVGTLTSIAIDFVSQVAYVGTRVTLNLYAVNISLTGQSTASTTSTAFPSWVSSLALTPDGLTLYYASVSNQRGSFAAINSLQVRRGLYRRPQHRHRRVQLSHPDLA